MPNILLTRIDNRLIHGQVGVTWVNHLGANLILVANDRAANDPVSQSLMQMVLPDTISTRFFTLEKTINIINKASERQKIFLVCETPQDALKLVQGGVPIIKVNIGNMHFKEGKKQITSTIFVNEDDLNAFKEIKNLGVNLEIRRVPEEKIEMDINKLI